MGKLQTKAEIRLMIYLSVAVYFFSYLTRINYTAIIVELVASEGITKSSASIVTTIACATYGCGQLISGYLGDRFSPRWIIFGGYLLTVSMNFLMPLLSGNITAMSVVWGLNGIAQAFMWPPLVKIMTAALPEEDYSRAVPYIGMGSAVASIVVYLFSPLIIRFLGWKFVFFIFGGIALAASFVWIFATGKLLKNVEIRYLKKEEHRPRVRERRQKDNLILRYFPIIIIVIAFQGLLREGITTWVPSFISETFHLKSTVSILTGVVLPVFPVIFNLFAYRVLKHFKDQVFKTITLYFLCAAVLLSGLFAFGMSSMWISLLLLSLVSGIINSVNLLQTAYIPKYFTSIGSVSTISGVLNFSTYIGSAVSTYLFAVISERFGWGTTVAYWAVFAVCATVLSLFIQRKCEGIRRCPGKRDF